MYSINTVSFENKANLSDISFNKISSNLFFFGLRIKGYEVNIINVVYSPDRQNYYQTNWLKNDGSVIYMNSVSMLKDNDNHLTIDFNYSDERLKNLKEDQFDKFLLSKDLYTYVCSYLDRNKNINDCFKESNVYFENKIIHFFGNIFRIKS